MEGEIDIPDGNRIEALQDFQTVWSSIPAGKWFYKGAGGSYKLTKYGFGMLDYDLENDAYGNGSLYVMSRSVRKFRKLLRLQGYKDANQRISA